MISLEIAATIAFFGVVGALLVIDRKNVQFQYGIILRKWKFGVEAIDRLVGKTKKFLTNVGDVSICLGLVAGLVGIAFLFYSIVSVQQSFMLVLPTVGSFRYPGPVLSIPFWYWLIGVFVIITSHESMHAVFARLAKVPIKTYGIITLLVLPIGAFVDPDMKKVKKLKLAEKLRIYSAGSFANLVVGFLVFLIAFASFSMFGALTESVGIKIGSTISGTPAHEAGVSGILYKIDNTSINSTQGLSLFMEKILPGENLTLYTTEGIFPIKTINHPENKSLPFMGIGNLTNVYRYKRMFTGYVPETVLNGIFVWLNLLSWLLVLNIGVAIFNMLPVRPLDGGLIYEEIFKKKFGRKGKKIMRIVELTMLALIIFNLFIMYLIRTFI